MNTDIDFFCPRWGCENLPWKVFAETVRNAGYDGIEYAVAASVSDAELDEAWNMAERFGLMMIAQHYDTQTADFSLHHDQYSRWLERISAYPMLKLNSQTGKDFFTKDQNLQLLETASAYAEKAGLELVHETHRGKFSYAAHVTKEYLELMPELRLTLDVSHWVCVAESFLEDQVEAVALAIARTDHIHSRVGYAEGPQVADPRAPEWQQALDIHLGWWDKVLQRKRSEGKTLTVTTEFGPFPYMVQLPDTGKPIADQWDVNVFMMGLLRAQNPGGS